MKLMYRTITVLVTVFSLILPVQAFARDSGWHRHRDWDHHRRWDDHHRWDRPHGWDHHKKILVVNPRYRPMPRHHHAPWYKRHALPIGATFAIIAGITYAVIDNAYYRQSGDTYVYVEHPPVIAPQASTTTTVTSGTPSPGTLLDDLPEDTTVVTVNGTTFYVDGEVWYAPVAGTRQFVVVAPQL